MQKKINEYFTKKRDRHFIEEGRGAEITVDLALQARARPSEKTRLTHLKTMIKRLPL